MKGFKAYLWFLGLSLFGLGGCSSSYLDVLKEGDILFQDMPGSQSQAIKLATHSRFTHVGILLPRNGQPYICEGVGPVKFTPLEKWVQQGEGAHFVARRLKDSAKILHYEFKKNLKEFRL